MFLGQFHVDFLEGGWKIVFINKHLIAFICLVSIFKGPDVGPSDPWKRGNFAKKIVNFFENLYKNENSSKAGSEILKKPFIIK